jgi:hypothetical protein
MIVALTRSVTIAVAAAVGPGDMSGGSGGIAEE